MYFNHIPRETLQMYRPDIRVTNQRRFFSYNWIAQTEFRFFCPAHRFFSNSVAVNAAASNRDSSSPFPIFYRLQYIYVESTRHATKGHLFQKTRFPSTTSDVASRGTLIIPNSAPYRCRCCSTRGYSHEWRGGISACEKTFHPVERGH